MKSYIITRFSIYDPSYSGFKLTKKKELKQKYKEILFSDNRLAFKFKIFEMVTLPSIVNQTNQNFEWYIYASTFLYDVYKDKLLNYSKLYPRIKIVFVNNFKEFFEFKELKHLDYDKEPFCTIRLDDDDGLCKNFIQILNDKYKHERNKIISFPKGLKFILDNNKIKIGKKKNFPMTAVGLTGIGINIHLCGSHDKVKNYNNVICDNMEDSYLCCTGYWCDSNRT